MSWHLGGECVAWILGTSSQEIYSPVRRGNTVYFESRLGRAQAGLMHKTSSLD